MRREGMRVNYFFSLIMILLLISFSSIISSENVLAKEADDEQTEVNEKEDTGSDDEDASEEEVEVIDKLSLEDAIEYNEKSNFSLLKLENNLNNVKSQLAGTEDKYRDLKFDIRDLEREMDRLRKYGSATFDARYEIQEML